MKSPQEVLNVVKGMDHRWYVLINELDAPIAFFDTPHEACAWAIAHAKPKRGRVFLEKTPVDIENDGGTFSRAPWLNSSPGTSKIKS